MFKIFQVDSFTNKAFQGNPAGVCLLDKPMDTDWMQNVAMEMNLSETAFLLKDTDSYRLRWFTPAIEVDLCGHATLASAHILFQEELVFPDSVINFQTRSGLLKVAQQDGWLEMDFPVDPERPVEVAPILQQGIGGPLPQYTGKSKRFYLFRFKSEKDVFDLKPDFNMLADIPDSEVIVTAVSDNPEFDFVSRFFAPGIGINEDPVTGSAHCTLGPYWQKELGKSQLTAFQASKRGGLLKLDVGTKRIKIKGQAITVIRGTI